MEDGRLSLLLELGGFEEVARWILSRDDHAQVLSPPALIDRIKATMTRSLKNY
ncbi:WYL domain-containing protein [bacterium]|nr:WYL domain-containing protein [bacterium]